MDAILKGFGALISAKFTAEPAGHGPNAPRQPDV
jgi:hypothetical protein